MIASAVHCRSYRCFDFEMIVVAGALFVSYIVSYMVEDTPRVVGAPKHRTERAICIDSGWRGVPKIAALRHRMLLSIGIA